MAFLPKRSRSRAGFTLIELLIVVAIIVVLVGLLLAGIFYAFTRMKQTQALADVNQLDASMKAFKAKYGRYPPSRIHLCSNYSSYGNTQLDIDSKNFLMSIWPGFGPATWSNINWAGNGNTIDEILEGDQCLVFFLGGIPWDPTSVTLNGAGGFSVNPKNPAAITSGAGIVPPFFAFEASRLKVINGQNFPSYLDPFGVPNASTTPMGAPYVYFSSYNFPNGYGKSYAIPLYGTQPYYTSANKYWNPNNYQILCAGPNGVFGAGGQWTAASAELVYPTGSAGSDDLSNFYGAPLGTSQ